MDADGSTKLARRSLTCLIVRTRNELRLDGQLVLRQTERLLSQLLRDAAADLERARDAGVLAQQLRFPVDTPEEVTVSWDELRDTLYVLSVLFGVLRLPKATLYGVWNGKGGEDWHRQRLEVDCRSKNVGRKLRRDDAIATQYEETWEG